MNWVFLIFAEIFEIAFAFCLGKTKTADGQSIYWWYSIFFITLILSLFFLLKAIKNIPVGTAYAVWTGIGAFGTAIIGIIYTKTQ